jgi:predicted RNA-binding Zn-ribbon protein involved in translation (DUF1610 family)
MTDPVTITRVRYLGTDELTTEFYECPSCEFSRVPHIGGRHPDLNDEEKQTRFCPHCGIPVVWLLDKEG